MTKRLNPPSPVMGTRTRLHAYQARRKVGEKLRHFSALQLRIRTLPRLVTPCTWNTCLARSIPTVVTSIVDAPARCEWSMTLPLWHIDAVKGWGASIPLLTNEASSTPVMIAGSSATGRLPREVESLQRPTRRNELVQSLRLSWKIICRFGDSTFGFVSK